MPTLNEILGENGGNGNLNRNEERVSDEVGHQLRADVSYALVLKTMHMSLKAGDPGLFRKFELQDARISDFTKFDLIKKVFAPAMIFYSNVAVFSTVTGKDIQEEIYLMNSPTTEPMAGLARRIETYAGTLYDDIMVIFFGRRFRVEDYPQSPFLNEIPEKIILRFRGSQTLEDNLKNEQVQNLLRES